MSLLGTCICISPHFCMHCAASYCTLALSAFLLFLYYKVLHCSAPRACTCRLLPSCYNKFEFVVCALSPSQKLQYPNTLMLLLHLISCTFHELEKVHKLARGKHFSVMACHTGYFGTHPPLNVEAGGYRKGGAAAPPLPVVGVFILFWWDSLTRGFGFWWYS